MGHNLNKLLFTQTIIQRWVDWRLRFASLLSRFSECEIAIRTPFWGPRNLPQPFEPRSLSGQLHSRLLNPPTSENSVIYGSPIRRRH